MATVLIVLASAAADAGIVTTTNPSLPNEIGARIRWGATGFEASVWDANPFGQSPTLNPAGTPVWGVGNAYGFQVSFDGVTGTLGLSIDFNRDTSFGAGESISRSLFSAPPQTSYVGLGFKYLSISGNEGGSAARSQLTSLTINGTPLASMAPGGLFLENFYKDSSGNPMTSILITGQLTFLTAGTGQERPSWNFNFKDSAAPAPVPEPSTVTLLGLGAAGLVAYTLRRGRRERAR